jgi:hypothetical protein
MKREEKYHAVIIKLDHHTFEKEVNRVICDHVDPNIFIYFEATTGPECHEGITYEDALLIQLQRIDSFMIAMKDPEGMAFEMGVGHQPRERLKTFTHLPTKFHLTGTAGDILIPSPGFRKEFSEAEGLGDEVEYGKYADYISIYSKEAFLSRVKRWRTDPSIFDEFLSIAVPAAETFVRWLESTGKYPFDFDEWRSILTEIEPGNPENLSLAFKRRNMVTSFRDYVTVNTVKEKAREGRYKKFVISVGSAHAQSIKNRLDGPEWNIQMVEKGDIEGFVDTLYRLREVTATIDWSIF